MDKVSCAALPAWVVHQPYREQTPEPYDDYVDGGLYRILTDTQIDLSGAEHARHSRTAQRVLTRSGAEAIAHFTAEYNPAYQRLEINFVRVTRGGQSVDHARLDLLEVFRRQTTVLDFRALTKRLTVSLLIPDVRIDDVVEIAFTRYGGPPILEGKFATWISFEAFAPWAEERHRLLRSSSTKIFTRAFNNPPELAAIEVGDLIDWRWTVVCLPKCGREDLSPSWQVTQPALQLTEFGSWGEVARVFAPHYATVGPLPESLVEELDSLASAFPDRAARAVEWLRHIQHRMRYLALPFGEDGARLRPIEEMWEARVGDCRDLARLYVAGAVRLGINACVTLVSADTGPGLQDFLPSSTFFGHCLVRVHLQGKSYWLDPTQETQWGNLETIYQSDLGWALPLAEDTVALAAMGDSAPVHILNWEQDVHFAAKPEVPAKLDRPVEYLSHYADTMRIRFANGGAADHARGALTSLQATQPGAVEIEPMQVRDDRTANRLTVVFSYELRDCWKPNGKGLSFDIDHTNLSAILPRRTALGRRGDIHLGLSRKLTRHTRLHMPKVWSGQDWYQAESVPGLLYADQLTAADRLISRTTELEVSAWSLPAKQAPLYDRVAAELGDVNLEIHAQRRFGRIRAPIKRGSYFRMSSGSWKLLVATLALLALIRLFNH